MDLAPPLVVVLGSIAFAVFWVLAVFPTAPFLPIGRTAGSLLGATLMVILKVLSPEEAYSSIDLQILGLLFGTMVLSIYLEKADVFKYLTILLTWKSRGAKDLLCRICVVAAISSIFFTNDTSCVFLTEFVLKLARRNNFPPHPFLLALASSANIGSSASPIGNPQNLIIVTESNISFLGFLLGLLPAMLVGMVVNTLILLCMFWKDLGEEECLVTEYVSSHEISPPAISNQSSSQEWYFSLEAGVEQSFPNKDGLGGDEFSRMREENYWEGVNGNREGGSGDHVIPLEEKEISDVRWKRLLWKTGVYLVTIGMLIALLMNYNMSWTALSAAVALTVLDFKDARPCLEKVSYSILIFFSGMFITVEGFNRTGIPGTLWNIMERHAQLNSISGLVVLSLVILVLSNVVSNVPTVLLLGVRVATAASMISRSEVKKAWLVLAWVSTVAGNLTLLGSAANLIVCEQARKVPFFAYTLSFWRHLKFGVPSTLIVTTVGLMLITS